MCQRWETGAAHARLPGRPLIPAWEPAEPYGLEQQTRSEDELQAWMDWYRDGAGLSWRPNRAVPGFESQPLVRQLQMHDEWREGLSHPVVGLLGHRAGYYCCTSNWELHLCQ